MTVDPLNYTSEEAYNRDVKSYEAEQEGGSYFDRLRQLACVNADPDAEKCGCNGYGWLSTDYDTYHTCPFHYTRQDWPEYAYYGGEFDDE